MICERCGSSIYPSDPFCPVCGAPVARSGGDFYGSSDSGYNNYMGQSSYQRGGSNGGSGEATGVLVWGIIGLCFACSFFLSFLGIVFSAIGRYRYRTYVGKWGESSTKARIGGILSLVGFILGIVFTVFFIWFIAKINRW